MQEDRDETKAKKVILSNVFLIIRKFYENIFNLLNIDPSTNSLLSNIALTLLISLLFAWLLPILFVVDILLVFFLPSLHIFKPLFKAGWKYSLITAIGVTLAVSIISQYVFYIYSYQFQAFDLYLEEEPRTYIQVQIDSVQIQQSITQPFLIDRIAERSIEEMNVSANILQRDLFFQRGTFIYTRNPINNETYFPNTPLYGVTDRTSLFLANHIDIGNYPEENNEVLAVITERFYQTTDLRVNQSREIYIPIALSKVASLLNSGAHTTVKIAGIVFLDNLTDFPIIGSQKSIPIDDMLGFSEGAALISPWIFSSTILHNIQLTSGYATIFDNLFYDISSINTFELDNEINKLKQIALGLQDSFYQLGGYSGVDINSYLVNSLESFKDEFNLYQIFMFSFLAPLIVLTLILTVYAANLVRKKRERQLTILTERGTTKWEIGSYLALESLVFGFVALIVGILLGIPISAILTKSSGFLSFSNPVISLQLEFSSVLFALLGSVVTIIIIQMINVITLLKRRSLEDFGRVEKSLPTFYNYYIDFALVIIGGVLWFIYKLPALSGFRDQTTKIIGIPAMITLLFGIVLMIQRLLPFFSKGLLAITQRIGKSIKKVLNLDIASVGIKEITRYQSSFSRSSIILCLSFAIVVSAISVPTTYQKYNLDNAYYDLGADIVIEDFPVQNSYLLDSIQNVSEIDSATVVRYAGIVDVSGDYAITHAILGINRTTYPQTTFFRDDFADSSLNEMLELIKTNTTVLAQSDELQTLDKNIGDKLNLGYRGYNETMRTTTGSPFFHTNITVEIVGLFKYWPMLVKEISIGNTREILNHFVADISIFNQLQVSPYEVRDYLLINVNPNENIDDVTEQIQILTGTSAISVYSRVFVREGSARSSILYSAINSTLIMAFTINTIIIALFASVQLIDRARDIATMKAIGVSRKQLLTLFLSEYLTLLIFSTIMGLISGTFTSWMLMSILTITRSIPPFIMIFPVGLLALVVMILLSTAFIGAIIPAISATNKNIGTDLRQST